MTILKLVFLFIAIVYTISIIVKVYYKNDIGGIQMVLLAGSIIGFLYLQFDFLK